MKQQSLTTATALWALTLGATAAFAQTGTPGRTTFVCTPDSAGVPTTYAQTPRGAVPVIKWVSEHFSDSGYSPQTRCQIVTGRFNTLHRAGRLNYLSASVQNSQPVICALSQLGDQCTLLYTLKPGQNPNVVLERLQAVRQGAAGPLLESSDDTDTPGDGTIDFNQYLNTAPVEQIAPAPLAAPAPPSALEKPSAQPEKPSAQPATSLW
ncbi:COP23 domain-containing protein [Kamptonema formosum]|uniref:COP23 domain-containing protein n=1 Tax=Kamptonema formosum TaxID=331992 RepID=UPI0003463224|nr:COP23 domain-containing protein [Oscillatoria sp. PCC 10802]